MKTTELITEQLVLGGLVLLMAVLPFSPDLFEFVQEGNQGTVVALLGASTLVVAAFLLGILFDRIADSLFEGLERHHRARETAKELARRLDVDPGRSPERCLYEKVDPEALAELRRADPFPEDRIRVDLLERGGDHATWSNYLRMRIRLARALGAFLPGILVAGSLGLAWQTIPVYLRAAGALAVALVYLFALLWPRRRAVPRPGELIVEGSKRAELSPYVAARNLWECACPACQESERDPTADFLREPVFWSSLCLLLAALFLHAAPTVHAGFIVMPFVGAALTALSWWTWWRISETYRRFLLQTGRTG